MNRLLPFIAAAAVITASPAGAAVPPAATVTTLWGSVLWHPADSAAWSPARLGLGLMAGSVVRTGPRAMVRLRWADGGEFRLDPLSELVVSGRDNADVTMGQVWAKFRSKLFAPFQFHSPSATAVVRGTILGFGVDEQGGTRVDVQEGHVEVHGHDGTPVMVGPGQRVLVSPGGQLGQVGARGLDAPSCSP